MGVDMAVGVNGAAGADGEGVATTIMIRPSSTMIIQMSIMAALMGALISTRPEAEGSWKISSDGTRKLNFAQSGLKGFWLLSGPLVHVYHSGQIGM